MNLQAAQSILEEYTKGEALLSHAESVGLVMKAYAKHYGEDEEKWQITGLLHDADYEAFPEQHPHIIVAKLEEMGELDIAYAISAHYSKWGKPHISLLDKALLACDELTGFIIACARLRPDGFQGLEARSVKKKLKQKTFAAGVDRDEVQLGISLLETDLDTHISFIIDALKDSGYKIPGK
jgi:predicted hydrolase (HD superfamily)